MIDKMLTVEPCILPYSNLCMFETSIIQNLKRLYKQPHSEITLSMSTYVTERHFLDESSLD